MFINRLIVVNYRYVFRFCEKQTCVRKLNDLYCSKLDADHMRNQ